jgi:hypothetical protein
LKQEASFLIRFVASDVASVKGKVASLSLSKNGDDGYTSTAKSDEVNIENAVHKLAVRVGFGL